MTIIRYVKQKSRLAMEKDSGILHCVILEESEHGRIHTVLVSRGGRVSSLQCFVVRSYEEAVELQTKIINGVPF